MENCLQNGNPRGRQCKTVRDMYTIYDAGPDSAAYSAVLHDWVLNRTAQDWSHKSFLRKKIMFLPEIFLLFSNLRIQFRISVFPKALFLPFFLRLL